MENRHAASGCELTVVGIGASNQVKLASRRSESWEESWGGRADEQAREVAPGSGARVESIEVVDEVYSGARSVLSYVLVNR